MSQISIRNVDAKTAARLKRNAQRRGQSLNRYLQSLLRETAEGDAPVARGSRHDLDGLAGTWTATDADRFERATAPFSDVDKALWR